MAEKDPARGDLLGRWRALETARDSMREYRAVRRIQAVDYASEVLEQNRKTLEAAMQVIADSRIPSLTFETVAFIHNYSSSLYSFRKAIEAIIRPGIRGKLPGAREMESAANAVFLSEPVSFLLMLRDCCQHHRMPVEFTLAGGGTSDSGVPARRRLALLAAPLSIYAASESRSGKDYLAVAKRYLDDKGIGGYGAVDLWMTMTAAHRLLGDLRSDMRAWIPAAYKLELEAVKSTNRELEHAELAWRLDVTTIEHIGYPGRMVGEYLSPEAAKRMCSVDTLLGDPAAIAIELLEAIHPVDDELRSVLVHAFALWAMQTGRTSPPV